MLRLHDLRDTVETRLALDGLVSVTATPGIARLPGVRPGSFARGLDIGLTFEPQAWQAGGLFLLASVLERFLARHAALNSFTQTRLHSPVRGDILNGRPRCGARPVL
jgi:type VI secretion system protein ImpG